LRDSLTTEEGYTSADTRTELLGRTGTALTPLRPAGTAQIGEERIDVVTSGEFISANSPIIVIQVEGSRIVVRKEEERQV